MLTRPSINHALRMAVLLGAAAVLLAACGGKSADPGAGKGRQHRPGDGAQFDTDPEPDPVPHQPGRERAIQRRPTDYGSAGRQRNARWKTHLHRRFGRFVQFDRGAIRDYER